MKKLLNVKQMKDAYVMYAESQESMDHIYVSFETMADMGFITHNEWNKFFEDTKGWYFDEDEYAIMDGVNLTNGEPTKVFWYDGGIAYRAY